MDLNALYNELLGRGADTSGTAFYAGMGADQVRSALMASPEYQSRAQAQQMQASAPAATPGGANPNFYVPQSLLNSLGVTSAQAQAGQYTPASNPWQGYASQPQSTATTLDALNVAKQAAAGQNGNYTTGSWQSNVANAVNPSLATGNPTATTGMPQSGQYDKQMQELLAQLQAQQKSITGLQTGMQSGWDSLTKGLQSMPQTAAYGGVFGNQSPTYSPQSKNGYGQGWGGSNPFKIGSF